MKELDAGKAEKVGEGDYATEIWKVAGLNDMAKQEKKDIRKHLLELEKVTPEAQSRSDQDSIDPIPRGPSCDPRPSACETAGPAEWGGRGAAIRAEYFSSSSCVGLNPI